MTDNKDKPIDLSSIENFEIEPSWVKKGSDSKYNSYSERKEYSGGKVRKRERGSGQLNSRKPKYTKDNNQPKDETIFEFQILPRREILEKIKTEMRKTGISYSLTDICETISAKGERCSVRIRFKDNKEKDSSSNSGGNGSERGGVNELSFFSLQVTVADLLYFWLPCLSVLCFYRTLRKA